ncbi:MAG TPA: serine hydrolase domain-containing protein, partial [Actinomycetota bacterium]|nr:serine hydrolase domain-containing protein [Actinomycetota bacterium]
RSEPVRPGLATGYTLGSGGAKAVADYEIVTVGGGGAYSTARDMARYAEALLGGGANEHGSVLKPETLATMFEPHYQPDPRVPGIGLAFNRGNADGHRVIEHGGILPGFDCQLVVAPDDGVGVLAFTNGARRAMFWLPNEVAGLLNHLLGVSDRTIRTDIPQHPELWAELCGWYQLSARLTDARARMAAGAGAEVLVRGGRLVLRVLTPIPGAFRGFVLHPDDPNDPYVFRIDLSQFGLGTLRLVFTREPGGRVTAVHLAEGKPLSARKRPAKTNPRLGACGALGALAVATTARAVRRASHSSYPKGDGEA